VALLLFITAFAFGASEAASAISQADVTRSVEQFDDVRALAMRALLRAQELKTAHLYGRGFKLNMPEYVAEDILIEGLWLFDYLNSLDSTSMSLLSYAAAGEHPNLGEELTVFRAYLSEAAKKTVDYYDKTSKALADAVRRVNATATRRSEFFVETIPPQPWTDDAAAIALAGDGFNLGWSWYAIQNEGSRLDRHLEQHGYGQDHLFKLAAKAGVDFIAPNDRNLFEWIDVETEDGKYYWGRIDKMLARYKKHGIALWLAVPSVSGSPPGWLSKRLKNKAVLTGYKDDPLTAWTGVPDLIIGTHDARGSNTRLNLFNPEVARLFARYLQKLLMHVQQSGVRIFAVQLGPGSVLPSYGGPEADARWQAWLHRNKIDPRERWNMNIRAEEAGLPEKVRTAGVTDPGRRHMMIDLIRWREDENVEYFRVQTDAIREVAPDVPICISSFDTGHGNHSTNGRSDESLIRKLRLTPFGGGGGSRTWDALRRCYSPGVWSVAPTHCDLGNNHSRNSFPAYTHGTIAVMSDFVPLVRGFYYLGFKFVYPDLRWLWSSLGGYRRFHERAQGMAPEMLNTRPAPQVAIMWSDTTHRHQSFIYDHIGGTRGFWPGTANYHKIGCIGFTTALDSLSMAYDFITESQVRQGKLKQYQMLIMPAVQALPADVAEHIRGFVKSGGMAIATSAPALFDDDFQRKGAGQLADVFGADFDQFLGKSVIENVAVRAPLSQAPIYGGPKPPDESKAKQEDKRLRTLYCSFEKHPSAELLDSFTTGHAAGIFHWFDKGNTVIMGYPFGREYAFAGGHGGYRQDLLKRLAKMISRLGLRRDAVVSEETAPRPEGPDGHEPRRWWTRKGPGYRDFLWESRRMPNTTARGFEHSKGAPQSFELALRTREGNPNTYLTVLNREGTLGYDPGTVHYEAASKEIKIDLVRSASHVYDLSLGCAVPFRKEKTIGVDPKPVTTFRTMIEPSMARMFVVATQDNTIRKYSGNRLHGRSDDEIRKNVAALTTPGPAPDHVVIAPTDVARYLEERGRDGIVISAESPTYMPVAKRLAAAVEKAFGKKARVTRNSPRIGSFMPTFIDEPDVLLGNHNQSHYIAVQRIQIGHGNHTMRLPIMSSHTFPGPGRSATTLLRPFRKQSVDGGDAAKGRAFIEGYATPKLVVGASDLKGLEAAVERLIELIKKSGN